MTEAVARATTSQHKTGIVWMPRDQEVAVWCVCTPADPCERKGSIGQVRHTLTQEEADSLFGLLGDLVLGKGLARPM